MRRSTSTHYIKDKWEKESELQLSTEDWHNIQNIQQTTTIFRTWKEFCWKNIIRFFITVTKWFETPFVPMFSVVILVCKSSHSDYGTDQMKTNTQSF